PALYASWFAHRLEAGWCAVPNPMNMRQVRRVSLRREDVAGFVFWTRHPRPLFPVLERLDERGDPYYFQYTITGYGRPIEPRCPPLEVAVATFRALAERIGPERVTWRYDPIVLGPGFPEREHVRRFARIAAALEGATRQVVVSVLEPYRRTRRRTEAAAPGAVAWERDEPCEQRARSLLARLVAIARQHGMCMEACSQAADYSDLGIERTRCVDAERLESIGAGRRLSRAKDRGQRALCRCVVSRDIGIPDTCMFGCTYCYATRSDALARRRRSEHDPRAAALWGGFEPPPVREPRGVRQRSLFEAPPRRRG
ncbi:MAG: DUF1848 domain-containing protein, partial [Planctomycetota bacterium]